MFSSEVGTWTTIIFGQALLCIKKYTIYGENTDLKNLIEVFSKLNAAFFMSSTSLDWTQTQAGLIMLHIPGVGQMTFIPCTSKLK